MRPFNHQSILHAIRSHRTVLQCEALGISTQSRLSLRFPASNMSAGGTCLFPVSHYDKSSLEGAFQLHSSRRPWHPTEPNVSHQNSFHLTHQRTRPDLQLAAPTWRNGFQNTAVPPASRQKIDARSHEHTGRIRCT